MAENQPSDDTPENERIRHRITDMYADFVKSVNPKTHVMDCLIQKRIMSEETVQQLRASVTMTNQECCRAMLHELLNAGNPQAFIVLREALKQDYQYMVNRIDEAKAAHDVYTGDVTLGTSEHAADGSSKDVAEVKILKSTIRELTITINTLNYDMSQLKDEKKQLKENTAAQIAKLTNKLEQAQAELRESKQQNGELEAAVKTNHDEIINLNKQLDQAKTTAEEFSKISEQLRSRDAELATAKQRLQKAEESARKLRAALADKEMEKREQDDSAKGTTLRLKSAHATLAEKEKKIAEVESELKNVESRNKHLLSELQDKQKEIDQLHSDARDSAAAAVTEYKELLSDAESRERSLSTSLKAARDEVDELFQETKSLRAKLSYASTHHGESGLKMKALYDYTTDEERCLSLTEGEIITNVSLIDDAWASGRNFDGTKGLFPLNHCEEFQLHRSETVNELQSNFQGDDYAEATYQQLNFDEGDYDEGAFLKPTQTYYENFPEMPDTNIYNNSDAVSDASLNQEKPKAGALVTTRQDARGQLIPAGSGSPRSVKSRPTVVPPTSTELSAARYRRGERMALKSQPTLEMTIPDRRELVPSAAVVGLALLDDLQLLYVVRKKSFNVFVYDTTDQRQPQPPIKLRLTHVVPSSRRTLTITQRLASGGRHPSDITACPLNHCLYVAVTAANEDGVIVAIQLASKPGATDRYRSWPADGQPRGLSLTRNNNVLVCYSQEHRLSEYSPTGKLIHRINLPEAIDHPWRAVALDERVWVVSHGSARESASHRVCLIDGQLKQMTHSHGAARGADLDQLNEPRSLVVDAMNRVWVADSCNNRVKVLGVDLDNAQELLNADDKLSGPTCLCLNDNDGLLYIGQRSGKILVFRVLQQEL